MVRAGSPCVSTTKMLPEFFGRLQKYGVDEGGGKTVATPKERVPDIRAPLEDISEAPGVAGVCPYTNVGAVICTSSVIEK